MERFTRIAAAVSLTALVGCASTKKHDAPEASKENAVVHRASASDLEALRRTEPLDAPAATLWVNGLGCPLCATNIDAQLKRVKGIEQATVNLGAGTVAITMPGKTRPSPQRLADAVADAGFTLVRIEPK